jgi:glycosyltransferase involved in cell wall biosynthesis
MSFNSTLVTIGIPLYNEEKYIIDAVSSAIAQTYQNFKIVISDNNSSDKSYEVAQSFAAKDDRVTVVRQKENIGPIANFKYLLRNAETKYFIWLGAHDLLAPTFIEDAINKLEQNEAIIEVYPLMGQIIHNQKVDDYSQDNFYSNSKDISERIIKVIDNSNMGTATHGVFRTDVLKNVYLNIDINGGDLLFFLSAATYGLLVPSDKIGYYLKEARPNETEEEQNARYIRFGFKSNWRLIHSMYPFEIISNLSTINLNEKLDLLSKARLAMFRFKGNSWGQIILYHMKQFKFKVAFYTLHCKLKGL